MFRQLTAAALATLALAACEPTATASNEPYSTVPTGDYVLFNIGGEVLSVRHTSMKLTPTQITGKTGCNSFAAPISGTPPEITVGEIQTSGQTCRWSAQENSFLTALRAANRITYEDGVLRIAGGAKTLTFEYGRLASADGPIGRNLNPNARPTPAAGTAVDPLAPVASAAQ